MVDHGILVSEVGPRDGLQNIERVMDLSAKKDWISAEAAAGVREIEVGSFVSAKLLPQMADTAELVAFARGIKGLAVAALVPNFEGAQAAVEAGVHRIGLPLSVSEQHSLANLRRTHAQMLDEIQQIADYLGDLPPERRPAFGVGLSTAFGCSLTGPVSERAVVVLAEAAIRAGCDEVGLSDTTGYANPAQVRCLTRAVKRAIGEDRLNTLHLHNTRGLGLANACAGLEEDITTIDASLGGLGGCPFAPGASGNIVTEDLVFMLDAMGIPTGIDYDKLLEVRAILARALPGEPLYGFLPEAGLPKGHRRAPRLTAGAPV